MFYVAYDIQRTGHLLYLTGESDGNGDSDGEGDGGGDGGEQYPYDQTRGSRIAN